MVKICLELTRLVGHLKHAAITSARIKATQILHTFPNPFAFKFAYIKVKIDSDVAKRSRMVATVAHKLAGSGTFQASHRAASIAANRRKTCVVNTK